MVVIRPQPKRDIYLEQRARFATLEERMSIGRALRKRVPRSSHGSWSEQKNRPDPIALLDEQNKVRLQGLVPIRWGRMLESPFVFMRASALVMATDLASTSNSGIRVQACGDSHLLNFGAFATPERNLIFDINDFDETLPAPWEWDVKRLAASLEVAGRDRSFSPAKRADIVRTMVHSYRMLIRSLADMTALERWYSQLDTATIIQRFAKTAKARRDVKQATKQAQRRTMESAFVKMTEVVGGRRRMVDDPPRIFHVPERRGHPWLNKLVDLYRTTLRDDLHVLLDNYHVVDMVFKVVGVGSVGTRCGVGLWMANDGDALLLQVKEANRSVLDTYAGPSAYRNHGHRVVMGQRIMQTASDMFLGWATLQGRHYYFRQLRDMKWSLDPSSASVDQLTRWGEVCGATLAQAHARSTDPGVLSGYLGSKGALDEAMVAFANAYADQTERDYERLQTAVKNRRIKAVRGSSAQLAREIVEQSKAALK